MTILAIKPNNDELNVYLGTDSVWNACSRLRDGTSVVACGATPEDALAQLRQGCRDNLAPYSVGEYQEALQFVLEEEKEQIPYTQLAVELEELLGCVAPEQRPFGYWERWLTLALHVLEFVGPREEVKLSVAIA